MKTNLVKFKLRHSLISHAHTVIACFVCLDRCEVPLSCESCAKEVTTACGGMHIWNYTSKYSKIILISSALSALFIIFKAFLHNWWWRYACTHVQRSWALITAVTLIRAWWLRTSLFQDKLRNEDDVLVKCIDRRRGSIQVFMDIVKPSWWKRSSRIFAPWSNDLLSLAVCCPSGQPPLQLVEDMKLRGEESGFELQ